MKDPGIDDNRLAALLDGRLDERERAELLARLAQSDDDYEVLADTAGVLRELEAAGVGQPRAPEVAAPGDPGESERPSEPGVIPLRPRRARGWHRPGARRLALAAVLAAVALGSVLWLRRNAPDPVDPARLATVVAEGGASLSPEWVRSRPWRSTLGAGDPLTDEARAVRLGALLVDLELAVRQRDAATASLLASQVQVLLEDVDGAGQVADVYRQVGESAAEAPERLQYLLAAGRAGMADVVDRDLLGLGAWAEAARLAAARRDEAYFRTRETRAALDHAAELPVPGSAQDSIERIRRAIRGGGTLRWEEVQTELDRLLLAVGT
ncbi:MAG TPA: hypothetical protein VF746_30305 [Longimicrobium sp.]